MVSVFRRALGAAAVVSVLTACTTPPPVEPTPAPTPVPTPSQTPTESAQERQQRVDYEAAEQAYRDNVAEVDRLFNRGSMKMTSELKRTATKKYLSELREILAQVSEAGLHTTGHTRIVGVVPTGWSSGSISLEACEDISRAKLLDGKRNITPPGPKFYVQHLQIVSERGDWKINSSPSTKFDTLEGQQCAAP